MIPVKDHIAQQARVGSIDAYRTLYARSVDDPLGFWQEQSQRLDWFQRPRAVRQTDVSAVDFSWFPGGALNASYNCIDRHLPHKADKPAIIWACDEPGNYQYITYQQLYQHVGRIANVLLAKGVRKGDRVCIYLPMVPELAYTMLACARIGAIHSVVFAGFSADALRDRIVDAGSKVIVTANEGLRGGKHLPLKDITDKAIDGLDWIDAVLVAQRTEKPVEMQPGRDAWLEELARKQRPTCPPVWVDSEDPLFILYTSGSTGKPKGLMHTTAGYLLYTSMTHEYVFDLQPDDIYCCAADVGWITGHSYIVYGPLANGTTTVMFESTPLYPDPGRYWRVVDDLKVSLFYTAPTAIRAISRRGNSWVSKHTRKSLRVLGTVGEPINPEVWQWYHDVVGGGRCAVVDTWWQTETGGIMIAPLPGAIPAKPGSATLPFFGVQPVLVNEQGERLEDNDVSGILCLEGSWPGQARTIYGDHERFVTTYFSAYPGLYFTGDGCHRDADGYYWITGRVDDVLNVSGHRLGTAEIESALVAHAGVAEAAVVGFPHDIKGQGIMAFVILQPDWEAADGEELTGALQEQVREHLSPIAVPDQVYVVPGLPKTRSGKIMRRILRKVAEGQYSHLGDTSTLADPSVVDAIIDAHKGA